MAKRNNDEDFDNLTYLRARIKNANREKHLGVTVSFNIMSKGELCVLKAALDTILVKKETNPTLPEVYNISIEDIKNIITALLDAGIEEEIRRGWGY